jgi:hypothetical protein
MAPPLESKKVVSLEELLMSQVVRQEALNRLLVEKGNITKGEFLGMAEMMDGWCPWSNFSIQKR